MKYPRPNVFSAETERLLKVDEICISPSYTRDYPFIMHRGDGMEVMDIDRNVFMDFTAGIAVNATGHGHPVVKKAMIDQINRFVHMSGTDFYYKPQIDLASKLRDIAPFEFIGGKIFFGNSGAEAIEAAMKLARYNRKASTYIAFYGAFHGRTMGAVSLTASKPIQRGGFEPLSIVNHVPYADCYRCPFNCKKEDCVKNNSYQCIQFITDFVLGKKVDPSDVAAIVVEPIQGEGGYIVPPRGWLEALVRIAKHNNIPIVFDEVQSGMGRTGKWWACQHTDAFPDMITTAKGLASGMPISALLARDNLMEWEPGKHASTFGGNPVACAAALATIKVINEEHLRANAKQMGKKLTKGLEYLANECAAVENLRGIGLMQAIDISYDKVPYPIVRDKILMKCFDKGLLLLGCGQSGIRFCPSLIVREEDIDVCINVLLEAIKDTF